MFQLLKVKPTHSINTSIWLIKSEVLIVIITNDLAKNILLQDGFSVALMLSKNN